MVRDRGAAARHWLRLTLAVAKVAAEGRGRQGCLDGWGCGHGGMGWIDSSVVLAPQLIRRPVAFSQDARESSFARANRTGLRAQEQEKRRSERFESKVGRMHQHGVARMGECTPRRVRAPARLAIIAQRAHARAVFR